LNKDPRPIRERVKYVVGTKNGKDGRTIKGGKAGKKFIWAKNGEAKKTPSLRRPEMWAYDLPHKAGADRGR